MVPSTSNEKIEKSLNQSSTLLACADARYRRATIAQYLEIIDRRDENTIPLWREEAGPDDGWFALIRKLSWDSDFFGVCDARVEPIFSPQREFITTGLFESAKSFGKQIVNQAIKSGIEHLVAPVHSGDTLIQNALTQNDFFLADSIATYLLDLNKKRTPAARPTDKVRAATPADLDDLVTIAEACFGDRDQNINRFNSDPTYNPKAAKLYAEWIARSIAGELVDHVFVFEEDGKVVGFITLKKPSTTMLANDLPLGIIILNAVAPAYQGRGIYKALVEVALDWFQSVGVEMVEIKTQIGNTAIHRTWAGLDATLAMVHYTFHLRT